MARISRQQMFMGFARIASQRATCFRLNVGAIVVHDNNVVSIGYNGQEPGAPHCAGNNCPGIVPGKCGTLHAEHNALVKAQEILGSPEEVDLYVTHSPCLKCTILLMNQDLWVKRLFFEVPYREAEHMHLLKTYNDPTASYKGVRSTAVYEVTPAGYIVDHFSREVVEL